jgi:hypothetical protein
MKVLASSLLLSAAPTSLVAFNAVPSLFSGLKTSTFVQPSAQPNQAWRNDNDARVHAQSASLSELNAFKLKEGQTPNMFDGPMSLTRERDACGVGFIANTQSGGKCPTMSSSLFLSSCM